MAEKKTGQKGKGSAAAYDKRSRDGGVPEGFNRLTSDRGAPWVVFEENLEVRGYLLGRFDMKDKRGKTRYFFQVKLTEGPIECTQGRGDDKESVEMNKDDIVNINETKATEKFKKLAQTNGKYEIWMKVKEKIELENGQSFWDIETAERTIKAPTGAQRVEESESSDSDDVPF